MLCEANLTCLEIPLQNHHLLETKEIKIFRDRNARSFGEKRMSLWHMALPTSSSGLSWGVQNRDMRELFLGEKMSETTGTSNLQMLKPDLFGHVEVRFPEPE